MPTRNEPHCLRVRSSELILDRRGDEGEVRCRPALALRSSRVPSRSCSLRCVCGRRARSPCRARALTAIGPAPAGVPSRRLSRVLSRR
ncbi:unnamed protein product [Lota lota]